jgi:hypothetical protein
LDALYPFGGGGGGGGDDEADGGGGGGDDDDDDDEWQCNPSCKDIRSYPKFSEGMSTFIRAEMDCWLHIMWATQGSYFEVD